MSDIEMENTRFPLRTIPLFWKHGQLLPTQPLGVLPARETELTILHTNDLHAAVDGIPDANGKMRGGLARIATTIRHAREAGPTLVLDVGDIVFGASTWWDIQEAGIVAHLRGSAGCDLATIGNHDLEHGIDGLCELLAGRYPFVSANLHIEDEHFQQHMYPAYVVEIAGWHIGITGLTTLSTLDLIPARILKGTTLTEPRQELMKVVNALEPMIDTIIILSHLGFYRSGPGDPDLAKHVAGSKVSVILGGHTHDAHDPAHIIDGITICNAGAYGINVGEVTLRYSNQDSIEVQTRLLPQDDTIPDDPQWIMVRAEMVRRFQTLQTTSFQLPELPEPGSTAWNRDREWALLAKSLGETGIVSSSAILMVPLLYVLGQLAGEDQATLAKIMNTYPNIEYLVEAEITGKALKELIALQSSLLFYQQAQPLWVSSGIEVLSELIEDNNLYNIVTTELVCEGKLGWSLAHTAITSSRSLKRTCLQVVRDYLTSR
jgi:2',3'-cyclic-nucleotide 2'-phosphodiesterase (5'-nucleotidase family)